MVEINETEATVVEGESTTLYCNVTGKPDPTLTWTKVGNPRPLSNNAVLSTGILNRNDTISNIIQYQCTASNGVESPATAIANITVNCEYKLYLLKVIPLFCTAHPLLRITLSHPRWLRFFSLARKEHTRAAFAEVNLLFAIIMPQIGRQLPVLPSKDKKMKEMCVIPKKVCRGYPNPSP